MDNVRVIQAIIDSKIRMIANIFTSTNLLKNGTCIDKLTIIWKYKMVSATKHMSPIKR